MLTKRSLVLSAALSMLSVSPCYALDFSALVDKLLSPNNASWTTDQTTLRVTLKNREAELDRQIEAGARSGMLTTQEQADLRNQLLSVERQEGQYLADGNMSRTDARDLVDALNRVSRNLNVYLTNRSTTGYAATNIPSNVPPGKGWGYWSQHNRGSADDAPRDQISTQAMIDTKQAEIDSSLTRALTSGQITAAQSTSLRARLNAIALEESRAQADGKLTYKERDQLMDKLNGVDTSLRTSMRPIATRWTPYGNNPTQARSYIEQRIQAGIASGRLSRRQADEFTKQVRQINSMEAQMRNDGMVYTPTEQRTILAKLDELSDRLNRALR